MQFKTDSFHPINRIIGLLLLAMVILSAQTTNTVRIFTIGDSTVQNYDEGWYPRAGWGQVLHHFFDQSKVEVLNRAVGGTSSRSFYNNFWPSVKSELRAGDYVLIQFGINDRANDPDRKTNESEFNLDYAIGISFLLKYWLFR